jgi:hypothetical protein
MSLLDIPVELVLKVLVHLPVQSLHAFQLVSRACHQIVCESESYLYHNTANLHEFVSSTDSQRCDPPDVLEGPLDWRAFCASCMIMRMRLLTSGVKFVNNFRLSGAGWERDRPLKGRISISALTYTASNWTNSAVSSSLPTTGVVFECRLLQRE